MSGSVWNEVDVLPLAKQFVDHDWIANDWYLNLETNYRYLFQIIFGWLIVHLGFLATSIIGRLFCYGLVATGLVLLGQKLGLNLTYLLLATIALTYQGYLQGAIAGEWFVGGLEAKAVAYGLILIAIPLMLSRRYLWMMMLLGLATSFHVLVGGWAFLTTLGWLCLPPKARLLKLGQNIWLLFAVYLAASAFAIPPILQQLVASTPPGNISPSFIYVFLRLPHHLNPFAWHPLLWLRLAIYLGIWIWCVSLLKNIADAKGWQPVDYARLELTEFTLISLVPFVIGIAIAFFDSEGSFLQYYPFRFGDTILPLATYLLTACTLQTKFSVKKHRSICFILIGCILFTQITFFSQSAIAAQNFPTQQQNVDPQWKLMSDWIENNTPQDAVFISHPWYLANFTWMTQRATVVKLKMFPQTKDGIVEYYQRLNDLSGGNLAKIYFGSEKLDQVKTVKAISAGFSALNTSQVLKLMKKYQCEYFLTEIEHQLELPIVHIQAPYILYKSQLESNDLEN
ncbi:hypothetical protein I4641_13475 [Waterburya agarophytonicola K14]|uniref:DUF6798 domain-containing protein n=1 Tax=Waterburya agarophytonicola KI4 TaxID=2874699 RepID=A0A964FHY2_9CYAN|nr:DUF6798 domain-containing protein [Waterburya agarophytonicola]MCC0177989.1 hypothetical protein [Waterburya agarophytonicola KI4]